MAKLSRKGVVSASLTDSFPYQDGEVAYVDLYRRCCLPALYLYYP